MSGYSQVKGITVKINGDTTGLQKALNNVKAQTAGLDKTMSKLKSSMKLNPGDFQSFATYQDLLKDKITSTTKQIDVYTKAIKSYPKTHKEWANAVGQVKSELVTYDSALSSTKTSLSKLKKEQQSNVTQMSAWNQAFSKGLVTSEQYEKVMGELTSKNKSLSKEISTTVARQKELKEGSGSLKTELKNLGSTYEESQQSLKGMTAAQLTLKNQLQGLYNEFISTNTAILKIGDTLDKVSKKVDKFAETIKPLSAVSAALIAGSTAVAMSFEEAFTGVTKTVDATPKQFEKINQGLKQLAQTTASSYEDIASYAELAGQMGIPTQSIVGFTKTITQLGDTTNLVGEEAAQSLAKIANIMVKDSKKTNTYFSRMGSTIVDLGNKFATTESDIVATTKRLATAGRQAGMTTSDVLAISTALSSLGIEAQAGGGSVSKMIKSLQLAVSTGSDSLKSYAEVAGMTSEEFQKAWGEDATSAFLKFVEGIGNSGDVTKTLNDLGITEIRQSQAMGALAQSSEVLARALGVSKSAWNENTAMATEAEKRYATLKSQLSQTWETVKQAGNELGQAFTPILTNVLKGVKKVANAFINLDDSTKQNIATLLSITAAAYPVSKAFSKVTGATGKLVVSAVKGRTALIPLISSLKGTANIAEIGTPSILNLATSFATAHPLIAGTTVALGAFAAAVVFAKKAREKALATANQELANQDANYKATLNVIDAYKEYSNTMDSLNKKITKTVTSYEKQKKTASTLMDTIKQLNENETLNTAQKSLMKEAVQELNDLYPDLNVQIDENTGKLLLNEDANYSSIDAIEERISKLQEQAKEEALAAIAAKNATAQIKAEIENADLKSSLQNAVTAFHDLNDEYVNGEMSMQDYMAKTEALKESVQTLCTDLADSYDKLHETQANSIIQSNYLETQSMETMGTTMKNQLTELEKNAALAGVHIPLGIQEGIVNGTANAVEAANYMASLMTFNDLIDEAGMVGGNIPINVANGILANCSTITDATNAMNQLITLSNAVKSAGLEGQEITDTIAQKVASGEMTVGEAVTTMMQDADPNLEKAGKKMLKKASKTVTGVANTFSSDTSTAKAVDNYGSAMDQALGTHLDNMVTQSANAKKSISKNIQDAQNLADKTVIKIKTKNVATESLTSDRPVFDDAMALDADNLVQPLTLPDTVDTAVLSSRIITSSNVRSNSRIDALSNKLDSFIDAFMNSSLTVNLQPMELDGGIITDVVQEHISIRDLLSSWGKGDSGSSSVSSISSKELLNTWNK